MHSIRLFHATARRGLSGLAALAISLAAAAAPAQELTPFKIGIGAPIVPSLPIYLADEAGLYEKHGLDAEVIDVDGGTRALQILLAGEIDFAQAGMSSTVQANREGADLRVITATANTMPVVVFTRPEIKSAADLKGKTAVVSTFGGEADAAIGLALAELGMTRDDITIVQLGNTSQRLAAVLAGTADASAISEPIASRARAMGLNPLVDLAAAKAPWLYDAGVVRRQSLTEDRETMKSFVKALIEAAYLGRADPERAKALIGRVMKTEDPAELEVGYHVFRTIVPEDLAPSPEAAANVLKQLPEIGVEVGSTNVSDYIDTSLIEELRAEGFLDEMRQAYTVE